MHETAGPDAATVAGKGFSRTLAKAARFCFCAIPGAFLFVLIGPLCVWEAVVPGFAEPPVANRLAWFAGGVAALAAGVPLVLYGTRRWKRWGYLLPLAAIFPSIMFALDDDGAARLLILLVPFVVAMAVRRYYHRPGA